MEFTELEKKVLKTSRETDFGDILDYPLWVDAIIDNSELDPKIARGVISSLVKKGIFIVSNYDKNDKTISVTDKGRKIIENM